jgi:hypothetical protein
LAQCFDERVTYNTGHHDHVRVANIIRLERQKMKRLVAVDCAMFRGHPIFSARPRN